VVWSLLTSLLRTIRPFTKYVTLLGIRSHIVVNLSKSLI
jgi:hypothetical protein